MAYSPTDLRIYVAGAARAAVFLALMVACSSDGGGGTEPPPPPAPVASVTVAPATDTVTFVGSGQLLATLRDSAGHTLGGRVITWSTSDSDIVSVTATGAFTARTSGSATLTASSEGVSGAATIVAVPHVALSPRLPSLFAGDTTQLTARVTNAQNGVVTGLPIVWATASPGVATVSASGIVTAVAAGMATVTATAGAARSAVVVAVLTPVIGVNRKIAFLARANPGDFPYTALFVMEPDGSAVQQVSRDLVGISEYDWSPDGSRLAAQGQVPGDPQSAGLYLASADGTGFQYIMPAAGGPRWSPDGSRILFSTAETASRLATVRADGTGFQIVLGDTKGASLVHPEWSPDGRQIAFMRQTNFCEQLWVADANGSNARQIDVPAPTCRIRWRPDGKEIEFFGIVPPPDPNPHSGVWFVRPDGTGFRALSLNCAGSGCPLFQAYDVPEWSPDGSHLAFQINDAGDVGVSGPDGMGAVTIGLHQPAGSPAPPLPHWSPDGTRLLYTANDTVVTNRGMVGLMNVDGSQQTLLGDTSSRSMPSWQR